MKEYIYIKNNFRLMILIYLFAKDLTIIHIQIYFERISLIFYKKNLLNTISHKKRFNLILFIKK